MNRNVPFTLLVAALLAAGSAGIATPDHEETIFEYGPSLGCIGDFAVCVSEELGPGGDEIDGFWQELDSFYWGLEFVVTVTDIPWPDTDCVSYDADLMPITDHNNGAGPCGGILPEGTSYLFLYSYAVPAPGLVLEFTA